MRKIIYLVILLGFAPGLLAQNLTIEQKTEIYSIISKIRDENLPDKTVIDLANQLLQADPSNLTALSFRGYAYYGAGNYDNALNDFNSYLQKKPNTPLVLIYRALVKDKMKDKNGAIQDLQQASLLCENHHHLSYQIAGTYKSIGEIESAIEIYQRQIKNLPYNYKAYLGIARIRYEQKNFPEALDYYNQTLTALDRDIGFYHHNFSYVYRDKSKICYQLKMYEEAIETINQAILLKPDTPLYYDMRAGYYLAIGNNDAACYDIRYIEKIDPEYRPKTITDCRKTSTNYKPPGEWLQQVEAYSLYHKVHFKTMNRDLKIQSVEYLDQALKIMPDNLHFLGWRGSLLNSLSEYEKALEDFSKILSLMPDCSEAYMNRSSSKRGLRNMEGALEDIDKAILLNPKDAFYFENRAYHNIRMGDSLSAVHALDKAIALDNSSVYNYILRGDLKYKLKKDSDGALKDFQTAFEVQEQRPDMKYIPIYHSAAEIYDKAGEYEKALELINEDIAIDPEYGILYKLRGEVKARMKQMDEACKDWETAKRYGFGDAVEELLLYNCK